MQHFTHQSTFSGSCLPIVIAASEPNFEQTQGGTDIIIIIIIFIFFSTWTKNFFHWLLSA